MIRLNQIEQRTVIILLVSILVFLTVFLFKDDAIVHKESHYLAIHTLLELGSIAISFAIAMQAWIVFNYKQKKDRLLYFSVFFITGFLDLFHTMTYNGMPGLIMMEHSSNMAAWFWIIARATQAVFFIYIFNAKPKVLSSDKKVKYFLLSSLYIFLTFVILLLFKDKIPILDVEGQGPTLLKNVIEYVTSLLFLTVTVQLFFLYRKRKKPVLLDIILGIVFLLLSELIFTLYISEYDSLNILGHLYKIIGFGFFMKALYISTVKEPFDKLIQARTDLKNKEMKMTTITSSSVKGYL